MNPRPQSLLILANQNVSVRQLRDLVLDVVAATIVTTHHLLPGEQAAISDGSVRFLTFAELLTEDEMRQVDDEAWHYALAACCDRSLFFSMFMGYGVREKNRIIRRKLLAENNFDSIVFFAGLGISADVWTQDGIAMAGDYENFGWHRVTMWQRICKRVRELFCLRTVLILQQGNAVFFFFEKIGRIPFRKELNFQQYQTRKIWLRLRYPTLHAVSFREMFFQRIAQRFKGRKLIVAYGIHSFDFHGGKLPPGCFETVFQDGHLPSNCPVSFLGGFKGVHFLATDHFAFDWLKAAGIQVSTAAGLVSMPKMPGVSAASECRRILLTQGHAGDWSALINRSDSDLLLEEFIVAAKRHPEYDFSIRLHPTMTGAQYEGRHARCRVAEYLRELGLPNLSLSDRSLDEDMRMADLVVGEYSNVQVTGYFMGKPVICVNLTGRESFMKDYTELGFFEISSKEAFQCFFDRLPECFSDVVRRNTVAAENYNVELACFLQRHAAETAQNDEFC